MCIHSQGIERVCNRLYQFSYVNIPASTFENGAIGAKFIYFAAAINTFRTFL